MSNELLPESNVINTYSDEDYSRGTFGLGEVIDEDRICLNSKRCCRRKTCCPCLVIAVVILDILAVLTLLSWFILGIAFGISIIEEDEQKGHIMVRLSVNIMFLYSFLLVLLLVKIYFGLLWFCSGRTRKKFTKYYYITVTLSGYSIANNFIVGMLAICLKDYTDAETQFGNIVFCSIELALVAIHMKYLDELQFAKNDILRDRQILQ